MDDCSLEKLSIKPGKVSPPFQKDTLEYNATVGSNVEKVTFTCLASDTGASCSISASVKLFSIGSEGRHSLIPPFAQTKI